MASLGCQIREESKVIWSNLQNFPNPNQTERIKNSLDRIDRLVSHNPLLDEVQELTQDVRVILFADDDNDVPRPIKDNQIEKIKCILDKICDIAEETDTIPPEEGNKGYQ